MGELLRGYFTPNGSYLMEQQEEQAGAEPAATMAALGQKILDELKPDVVVVASPHWLPMSGFFVDTGAAHESFNDYPVRPQNFGRRLFSYTLPGHPELARGIIEAGKTAGLEATHKTYGIDHGAFCPLKVMGLKLPTVPVSTSRRSFAETLKWGAAIRAAVEVSDLRVVLVAPGNLTHRLDLRVDKGADVTYFPEGAAFDKAVIEYVESGRTADIGDIDPEIWKSAAPEADGRPLFILAGAAGSGRGEVVHYMETKYSVGDATFAFHTEAT